MESAAFIEWCLENLNYCIITLLMTIESSFIPFPSEIVVPPAAYMAAATGELNLYLVVLFATLGADLGALVNYYLARWLGRPLVYRFAESRVGRMCLLDREKVDHAEAYFNRYGIVSTFVGRLVPAVRQLISIPAGLARMPLSTFLLYTTLGAGIWNAILAAIGYHLEKVVPQEELMDHVMRYSSEIGWGFIGLALLVVLFLVYKGFKGRKTNR